MGKSDTPTMSPTMPFTANVGHVYDQKHIDSAKLQINIEDDPEVGRNYDNPPDCLSSAREFIYPRKFSRESEALFKAYFTRQRRGTFPTMVAFGLIFNIVGLTLNVLSKSPDRTWALAVMCFFTVVNLALFCFINLKLVSEWWLDYVMPYLVWGVLATQILCDLLMYYRPLTPSDGVAWQMLFIFTSFTILPLQVIHILCLNGFATMIHILVVGLRLTDNEHIVIQVGCLIFH